MSLRRLSGQSTAEYAIILAVVIGAAVAMQAYVKRGLQAKQKGAVDVFTGVQGTFKEETTGKTATFGKLSQYEPYYAESDYQRYQQNVEREHMGGGKIEKEKVTDITATKGYQAQKTATDKTDLEKQWE